MMEDFKLFDSLERYNLVFIKQKIFSFLDFKSLHRSRQVCSEWNSFILEEARKSRGSPDAKKTLRNCWLSGYYTKTTIECPRESGFYICADEQTVGVGTKQLKTLVIDIESGTEMLSMQSKEMEDVDEEDEEFYDIGHNDVQLDMTDAHVVTVSGGGNVNIVARDTDQVLYTGFPHGRDTVLGVRVVGDFAVTGGSKGSLAAYTMTRDKVEMVYCKMDVHQAISHIDSDGMRVLVGTEADMVMWDFRQRSSPSLESRVECGQVCCCVMQYPYAFCTGLFVNYGVQVWDMVNKTKLRHIHTDMSMWVITVRDNILATSMSVISDNEDIGDGLITPSIFLYDVRRLVDIKVKSEQLNPSEIKCPIEHFSDPHISLNSNSLFAITKHKKLPDQPYVSTGSNIHRWCFWNNHCQLCRAMIK